MEPNTFAYMALLFWPILALFLFARLPTATAVLVTILGAHLLLPVGTTIKIEALPAIDKVSVGTVVALVGAIVFGKRGPSAVRRSSALAKVLVILYIASPILTSIENTDSLTSGGRLLPGVGLYDAVSEIITRTIFLLPFFLGRTWLAEPRHPTLILRAIVIAALIYAIPIAYELQNEPAVTSHSIRLLPP